MNHTLPKDSQSPIKLVGNVTMLVDSSELLLAHSYDNQKQSAKKFFPSVVTPSQKIKTEFREFEESGCLLPLFSRFLAARPNNASSPSKRLDRTVMVFATLGLIILGITFSLFFRAEMNSVDKVVPDSFVTADVSSEQKVRASIHQDLEEGIPIDEQVGSLQTKMKALRAHKMVEGSSKTVLQVSPNF